MFNPFVLIHSRPAQYNYAIVYSGELFRAVSRILNLGGGGRLKIRIFIFWPTSFFSNQTQIDQFEKISAGQNVNI